LFSTIIDGAGEAEGIQAITRQISAQIEETSSGYDSDRLQERVAKRAGGLAVIQVGAATAIELKEKRLIAAPSGFKPAFSGRAGSSLANQLAAAPVAVAAGAALKNTSPVFGSRLDVTAGPGPVVRPRYGAVTTMRRAESRKPAAPAQSEYERSPFARQLRADRAGLRVLQGVSHGGWCATGAPYEGA